MSSPRFPNFKIPTLTFSLSSLPSNTSPNSMVPDPLEKQDLDSSPTEPGVELSALDVFIICWKLLCILAMSVGLAGNLFIMINVFTNPQMRNTNYFFILNLVVVDLFVIIGVLLVKEIALSFETDNPFLLCFPTIWNFVVNYTASNYILLFLCYEKLIIIILPFHKQKYLSMKVKASFTLTVYAMTLMIGLVKIHNMDPTRGSQWCAFSYPLVTEWLSDLFDVAFFIVPIALQILLYSFIFSKAKQIASRFDTRAAIARSTAVDHLNQQPKQDQQTEVQEKQRKNLSQKLEIQKDESSSKPENQREEIVYEDEETMKVHLDQRRQETPEEHEELQQPQQQHHQQQQQQQEQQQQQQQQYQQPRQHHTPQPHVGQNRRRQQPQLKVAKTCLVATVVRFTLWLPYVVHLVRLAFKQAVDDIEAHERTRFEQIADFFFPDLTIMASCSNPIVFIVMSPPLQRRLKRLFEFLKKIFCCPFCNQNHDHTNNNDDMALRALDAQRLAPPYGQGGIKYVHSGANQNAEKDEQMNGHLQQASSCGKIFLATEEKDECHTSVTAV